MFTSQFGCQFPIAFCQCFYDFFMLFQSSFASARTSQRSSTETLQLFLKNIYELYQTLIVCCLVNNIVECAVDVNNAVDVGIILIFRFGFLQHLTFQSIQFFISNAFRCQTYCQHFQCRAHFVYLVDVFHGHACNVSPFTRHHNNQTFQFQLTDCFTYRCTAYAHFIGQLDFH